MICECGASQWALYICDDGLYRCWQCRETGRGRVIVKPTPNPPGIERPYITKRRKK